MLNKPSKCSDFGTYDCQIPMPCSGRVRYIDYCVADLVAALNAANIHTVASCCGHGKCLGSICLSDGRHLVIYPDLESGNKAISAALNKGGK